MNGAALGDVLPAIAALDATVAERVLGPVPPERPIEELPAQVLLDEWFIGAHLVPPITARLVPVILDHEPLRVTPFVVLLPDLLRSHRSVPPARTTAAGFRDAQSWQSIEGSPAEFELRIGRSAALQLTAAAVREAALQSLGLATFEIRHAQPLDNASALSTIADWAAGELGLTRVVEAIDAARNDTYAPPEVRRALAIIDGRALSTLTTSKAATYDAFAATRRVLTFDARSMQVLERRLYAGSEKQTLDQLAQELGVTRERIRQIETHLRKQIGIRLEDEQYAVIRRAAGRLRDQIGDCHRLSDLPDQARWALELDDAPTPERALHARFLMSLTGPWERHLEWLLNQTHATLPADTQAAIAERLQGGPFPVDEACLVLQDYGVPEADCPDWLHLVCRCRTIDGMVIQWQGSMSDKAAAILEMRGEPLTGNELAEAIGPKTNYRSMITQIQADERFMRRGLKLYGLRRWGGEEYTTIRDEIEQEIDRQGGAATMEHLIEVLCEQFGVSESSVRAYASGASFARAANGMIVLTAGPVRFARRAIEDCRGCFRVGAHWAWRVIVDSEILRGSGRPLPDGVVQAVGMKPGDTRHMWTPTGELLLRYGRQSMIGSLRRAALHLGAEEGDRLFVILRSEDQLDFKRVALADIDGLDGLSRLAAEVGGESQEDAVEAIARALGLPSDEQNVHAIRRRLRARREDDLLPLLPTEHSPAPVDPDLLDELIGLGE